MHTTSLIEGLAHHEAEAWKAHHLKDSQKLKDEIASLYNLLYGIKFEIGQKAGAFTVKAAWLHDLAEALGDAGQKEKSESYWKETQENLIEHYKVLLSGMYESKNESILEEEIINKAKEIAEHDCNRWKVHHVRDYKKVAHEMAKIYELLLGIKYKKALESVEFVLKALQLHDLAEKAEDEQDTKKAEEYWNQVKNQLRFHFKLLLEVR